MTREPVLTASPLRILTGAAIMLCLAQCRHPEQNASSSTSMEAAASVAVPAARAGSAGAAETSNAVTSAVAGATTPVVGASGHAAVAPLAGPSAMAGPAGTGGAATASSTVSAGSAAAVGGSAGVVGATATLPGADAQGIPLAKRGDSKRASREYLNLGDFRILVNKWGSDELKCNTSMKVFVKDDASFGWSFDRGGCGGNKQKPDYPEIEFGMHPFGMSSMNATTPGFSSTSILPIQIKDITSASVQVDGLQADIQKATTWNTDVEFWLSQKNPVTEANPGVYAELIAFWGWQDSWGCDKSGTVTAGDKTYSLCHQDDNWANGQWRYYQFRADGGSSQGYTGKVDIKAFLDWLVNNHNYSTELWVTRIEVGSEIDDNTAGTVTLKNLTFEVNGSSKSAQLAP